MKAEESLCAQRMEDQLASGSNLMFQGLRLLRTVGKEMGREGAGAPNDSVQLDTGPSMMCGVGV